MLAIMIEMILQRRQGAITTTRNNNNTSILNNKLPLLLINEKPNINNTYMNNEVQDNPASACYFETYIKGGTSDSTVFRADVHVAYQVYYYYCYYDYYYYYY